MESKDLTQQISDKAKAAHLEREATLKEAKRIPMSSEYCDGYETGFTAGAQYGLSLQKDMMIGLLKFIANQEGDKKLTLCDHNWYFEADMEGANILEEETLATKYLSHLNQPGKEG